MACGVWTPCGDGNVSTLARMKLGDSPILTLVLLCAMMMSGCATYRADAIEGWVVDADTGRPVEGVVVVASWAIKTGLMDAHTFAQAKVLEAVTDHDGHYTFPAWGPKLMAVQMSAEMRGDQPALLLFKSGYKFGVFSNVEGPRKFVYNRQGLKLEPFKGSLAQYAENLHWLNWELFRIGYETGDQCGWKSFPRMLRALNAQAAEFDQARIPFGSIVWRLRRSEAQLIQAGCGTVDEVLKP